MLNGLYATMNRWRIDPSSCLIPVGWMNYLKNAFLIEKYGIKTSLNRKKWLSLQKNKRLIKKYGTK